MPFNYQLGAWHQMSPPEEIPDFIFEELYPSTQAKLANVPFKGFQLFGETMADTR